MRLNADPESGRSLVSHPRRKAGKGAVKLVHNEKRGAASLKPPPRALPDKIDHILNLRGMQRTRIG